MENIEGLTRLGRKFSIGSALIEHLGVRGKNIAELNGLDANTSPGFIISSKALPQILKMSSVSFKECMMHAHVHIEEDMKQHFNGDSNPLLLKIVENSVLNVVDSIPSVHNIGLNDATIAGFAKNVGEVFAWSEYLNVIRKILQLRLRTNIDTNAKNKINKVINECVRAKSESKERKAQAIDLARPFFPARFFSDSYVQMHEILKIYKAIFSVAESSHDSSVLVQAMVFGNYSANGGFGIMYTRNFITGDMPIFGSYYKNAFDAKGNSKEYSLRKLSAKHYAELEKLATALEAHFKEIRRVKFTVEQDVLWIIDQRVADQRTAIAEVKTLLSLEKAGIIDKEYFVKHITINRMSELLHPTLNPYSVQKSKVISGGIAGAVGAAVGRVYFSTPALIAAHKEASLQNKDTNFILAMPSTFAEDVRAIEIGKGVISSDGGYASHAPVVARSLGKVALVNPDIQFGNKSMVVEGVKIKEGDYITMNVPYESDPKIYLTKGSLIEQNPKDNGVLDVLDIISSLDIPLEVRANADQPKDAEMAMLFGASGIGLCRTEHMFFNSKRINLFRSMIIARNTTERCKILGKLEKMQAEDFYKIFKVMHKLPVSIRLLDAPLHEFLPRSADSMRDFVNFYRIQNPDMTANDIRYKCDLLAEFNPMLGHRGVRLAFTYPEIYKMQIRAIFKAAYRLKKEKIVIVPEIMIPLIMSPSELKVIRNGKKIAGKTLIGISDIDAEVKKEMKINAKLQYKIGTMVELPASALLADKIAAHAEFFSFGTNDLTQTSNGLSRDDFNNFYSDYNEFDLLDANPFQVLSEPVRELISIATQRGRLTRPNLKIGLCGEQGADPANTAFMVDVGLDYISCSPYGIPIAKLALAHYCIK